MPGSSDSKEPIGSAAHSASSAARATEASRSSIKDLKEPTEYDLANRPADQIARADAWPKAVGFLRCLPRPKPEPQP